MPAKVEQIQMAIGVHEKWKDRLEQTIASGESNLTVEKVRCDNKCALGMWLYSGGMADANHDPAFIQVRQLHQEFHVTSSRVLGLALAKQRGPAQKLLRGEFADKSNALVRALEAWQEALSGPNVVLLRTGTN